MPRERINHPRLRTITTPNGMNGLRDDEWGLHFEPDDQRPLDRGEYREPSMVVSLVWVAETPHPTGLGAPPSNYLTIEVEVAADEVLREADAIRARRARAALPWAEANPGVPEPLTKPEPTYETSIFSTVAISRHNAQKLIAMTRRARNAVFGGDE